MKKFIAIALLLVFVGGFIGVSVAYAADDEDLPCFTIWEICTDKKGDIDDPECMDLWVHCMDTLY